MTAPYVLAYDDGEPYWSDIAFGAVIALLAFVRATRARSESALSYLNFVAGLWVFVAAFWLYDSARFNTGISRSAIRPWFRQSSMWCLCLPWTVCQPVH
jgi:hypothetical protein